MPRAIWKGSISFGLVSIPVELHTAVRDHRPTLPEAEEEPQDGKVVDLMERLRQSLDSRTSTRARPKGAHATQTGTKKKPRHAA